jgi:two-component system, sensor histidine kinase and response regulator
MLFTEDKQYSVLIVDDNTRNIQLIGTMLKDAGYLIGFALDGRQALNLLEKENQYDLILLDYNMPVMNGFDTCIAIRAIPALNAVPIIFLTASVDSESIVTGFDLGAQDYVIKPFNSKELLVRIKTQLELKRSKEILNDINISLETQVQERTIELTQALNKLAILDNTKRDFLLLISHEMRTPLSSILGFAEIIQEITGNDEIKEFVDPLVVSVKRLMKFSETALSVTELKARETFKTFKQKRITGFLEDLVLKANEKLILKNLKIVLQDDSLNGEVNIDVELMEKCISNILDNAVRFSPVNSSIIIKAVVQNATVEISIKDEGHGFKDADVVMLGEMFSVGDIMHHQVGTGLSLAEAKLILDLHGGTIECGNRKTGGAEVKIVLPIAGSEKYS